MGGPQSWSGRFEENENLFELSLRGKAVVNPCAQLTAFHSVLTRGRRHKSSPKLNFTLSLRGLNSNYRPEWWGFKFTVHLRAITKAECDDTGNLQMYRRKDPYGATMLIFKG
jgi:hypothetical protein